MLNKQVIEKMYAEGLSYVEIAQTLNVKDDRVSYAYKETSNT